MKKNLICILMAVAISATAVAQQAGQSPQKRAPKQAKELSVEDIAKQRADRMRKELLLGNEQYDKVYKLMLKKVEKERRRQAEAKAENEALNKDMAKILNEAQLERYNDNRKPKFRRQMFRGRMPQMGRRPMGPMPQNRFKPMGYRAPFKGFAPRPATDSAKSKNCITPNRRRTDNTTGKAIEIKGEKKLNQNLYKIQENNK